MYRHVNGTIQSNSLNLLNMNVRYRDIWDNESVSPFQNVVY